MPLRHLVHHCLTDVSISLGEDCFVWMHVEAEVLVIEQDITIVTIRFVGVRGIAVRSCLFAGTVSR